MTDKNGQESQGRLRSNSKDRNAMKEEDEEEEEDCCTEM
jgi:hypothetical protein